jgi:DNA-binding CsgD family transcriptional regulator
MIACFRNAVSSEAMEVTLWPFEGREAELVRLRTAFRGSDANAVLITGAAGMGKTRLARESLDALGAERTTLVAATRAGRSIPFGAVLPLLPEGAAAGSPLEVMQAIAGELRARGGRPAVAIAVDDANLLDDASAALIAHLVTYNCAFAVLTARAGEPIADALQLPFRHGSGLHIELSRLPDEAIDALIEHAGVGGRERRRLRRMAQGNPLALHELVHGAQPGGLTDLVRSRLDGMAEEARWAVALVALGEPLSMGILEQLVGLDVVASAEESGLIVVEQAGRRRQARLHHPLYGEAMRSRLGVSSSVSAYRALSQALLGTQLRRREDALVAAIWQVEAGVISRPDIVRAGAWTAIGYSDLHVAERLAREARAAEPGDAADRLLAEILAYRGRPDEAADVLPAAAPAGRAEQAEWAVTRADTLYWGAGDLEAALTTLDNSAGGTLPRAYRSWLLFFDGQCAEAARIAHSILDQPDAEPKAHIWAAAAGSATNGFLGHLDVADAIHRVGAAVAATHAERMPWGMVEVNTGACLARLAGGLPAAAQTIAAEGYQSALNGGATMKVAGWALWGGLVALARGHLTAAERLLIEAQQGFSVNDTFGLARCALAAHAAVAALRGDGNAQNLMAQADAMARPANKVFSPWFDTWRGWTAYAMADVKVAVSTATAAADRAHEAGMPAVEALALYDVARMGASVDRSRLSGIADAMADTTARAAHALAGRDAATDLEAAAAEFESRGYDLLAAEAYTVAVHRHKRHARPAKAELALASAARLSEAFPDARTPLLRPDKLTGALTFRERQVLLLAAEYSSADIAERLQLAVTTVNNNLARAYQKLGIAGRAELRELMNRP